MGAAIGDVNGWLALLAFVLGLALTPVLMIRRAQREAPAGSETRSEGSSESGGATGFAGGRSGAESDPAN